MVLFLYSKFDRVEQRKQREKSYLKTTIVNVMVELEKKLEDWIHKIVWKQ